jgi:hypothetical protein
MNQSSFSEIEDRFPVDQSLVTAWKFVYGNTATFPAANRYSAFPTCIIYARVRVHGRSRYE